ncbi:MAG: hypothetical protein ACI4VT_01440 [Bacilli bacterium]
MKNITDSKSKKIITISIIGLIIILIIGVAFLIGSKSNKKAKPYEDRFEQPVKDRVESNDWTSGEYQFNGLYLDLGEPYATFKANNWLIKWKDLGYNEEPTLKPGETLNDLKLTHEIFTNSSGYVSLINKTKKSIKASEADVYGIEIKNDIDPYRMGFAIPGNIESESSKSQVMELYGAPTTIEKINDKEEAFIYDNGKVYLRLLFNQDEGLKAFKYLSR